MPSAAACPADDCSSSLENDLVFSVDFVVAVGVTGGGDDVVVAIVDDDAVEGADIAYRSPGNAIC